MKVKLVAIAKDESAYLPEWIYHHLNIGVDQINIHLNSISDFSHLLLSKISSKCNVNFFDSDDVKFNKEFDFNLGQNFLMNNPLQSRVFSMEYVNSSDEFDYVVYLDIDEFLILDGMNIKEYIRKSGTPDLIKIKWLNETCDDEEFSFYFKEKTYGYTSNATKCIVKTNIENIKFQSTHQIITPNNSERYLEGYGTLKERNKDTMESCFNEKVYILHRAYRSEMEYISLLLRGDNISNTNLGLKDNRPGRIDRKNLEIRNNESSLIHNNYLKFVDECDISYDIIIARDFVKKRFNTVEKIMSKLFSDLQQSKKVLRGTKLSRLFES